MAMQAGTRAGINVTPMIDILLVLLIAFMVMIPQKSTGLDARIPQQNDDVTSEASPPAPNDEIVIHIGDNGLLEINTQRVTLEELLAKLRAALRPGHPIFIQGDRGVEFEQVALVIDAARGIGAKEFALMQPPR